MEKNQINTATLLDIIFDERNKEYGAYELRRKYNQRLSRALGITGGMALLIFLSSYIVGGTRDKSSIGANKPDVVLREVDIPKEEPVVIPPEIEKPKPIATIQYTVPLIVEEDVQPTEEVPEITDVETAKISTVTQEGPHIDYVAPPIDDKSGVVEAPKGDAIDSIRLKVEIEAEFPGGVGAWTKYVSREVNKNIDELQDEGKSGTVVVLFVVDREGAVSDVKALGCGEAGVSNCLGAGSKLSEIAVNAIKKGPKWKAAIQNGKNVKAYRRQPVTFRLQEE